MIDTPTIPPKRRMPHSSLKRIAESLDLHQNAVLCSMSQAQRVQQHMRRIGRCGQIQTIAPNEVLVWRME